MDNWWIILIGIALAIVLHVFVSIKEWKVLVMLNLVFHIGCILLFLLLEMSLQQTFIFLLSSATINMLLQWLKTRKNDLK